MGRRTFILIFIIFIILTAFAFADDKQDKLQEFPAKEIDEFREKYGTSWRVEIDENTRAPTKLHGYNIPVTSIPFESTKDALKEYIKDFVDMNYGLFRIRPGELELTDVDYDPPLWDKSSSGTFYIFFNQVYRGLRVFNSTFGVVVDNEKMVLIDLNIYPDINISSEPQIPKEKAMIIALESLRIANKSDLVENVSLVVFPIRDGTPRYTLAWEIDSQLIPEIAGKWSVFIDANSGELLLKTNNVISETLTGNVSGTVYPEQPQQKAAVNLSGENVTLNKLLSKAFYSGNGNSLNNSMKTTNRVNLSNYTWANISFSARYDIEDSFDYAYLDASVDGLTWALLKQYTGKQLSWKIETANLSSFLGSQVFIRFRYVTDALLVKEGFYTDNISIITNTGTVFFDDAESGLGNWNASGFIIAGAYAEIASNITDKNGYYSIDAGAGNYTLRATLQGPFVSVVNYNKTDSLHESNLSVPALHSWNWNESDGSYSGEESNVFHHVNRVHEYFTRGDPFNVTSMDYQMLASVQDTTIESSCNAFSTGIDILFTPAGGGCNSTALSSDVIYHEYTHSVHYHVYGNTFSSPTGAVKEGLADYFAATMNNNSCMAETVFGSACLRNLSNNLRTPDNLAGQAHADSRIFSGALWDMRTKLGAGAADNLTVRAMKMRPDNFADYLNSILIADDNNANLSDGTPRINDICDSFYANHGILSDYCYTVGTAAYNYANNSNISIPDNDGWVFTQIAVPERGNVRRALVYVGINHTFIGDLQVDLISPDRTRITLHNRSGGSADNIYTWYDNETVVGGSAKLPALRYKEPNGTWVLNVTDKAAGDTGIITNFSFRLFIDKPPAINVLSPANNSFYSSVLFNITLDESASSCSRSLNQSQKADLAGADKNWFESAALSDGIYNVQFFCNDTANNTNSTNIVFFTADSTAPNIAFALPSDSNNSFVRRNYTFINVTVTDSNPDVCISEWNLTNYTMTKTGLSCFLNKSDADGTYTYKVYANDSAGNANSTKRTITFDTTLPSAMAVFSGGNNNTFSPNGDGVFDTITFNITASENVSFGTIFLFAQNGGKVKRFTTPVDTNPIARPWNGSCVDYCGDNATPVVPDGSYKIEITMTDRAGNVNATNLSIPIIVDTTSPSISFIGSTPNNETLLADSIVVNVTASETLQAALLEWNGINETMTGSGRNWSKAKTDLADANYTFRVYANDTAGNWNVTETRWVAINATRNVSAAISNINQTLAARGIKLHLLSSADGIVNDGLLLPHVNYTLRFNISNVLVETADFLSISLNASAIINITNNISAEANILNIFNQSGGSMDSYAWVDLNNLLPIGNFTAKITFPRIYPIYFYLNGTKDAPNMTRVLNACNANTSNVPCYNLSANTSTLYLPSFSGGAGGNDTKAPLLNVISPTSTTYTSSSILLNYSASDNVALDKCWYSLNAGSNINLANCTNATISAADGSNTITIYVNDTSNNINSTAITFTAAPATTTTAGSGGGGGFVQEENKTTTTIKEENNTLKGIVHNDSNNNRKEPDNKNENPIINITSLPDKNPTGLIAASQSNFIIGVIIIIVSSAFLIWKFKSPRKRFKFNKKKRRKK